MNTTRTPLREIVAYLGIAYSLALTVALALPDAHLNLLLSVAVPTVSWTVAIAPRWSCMPTSPGTRCRAETR